MNFHRKSLPMAAAIWGPKYFFRIGKLLFQAFASVPSFSSRYVLSSPLKKLTDWASLAIVFAHHRDQYIEMECEAAGISSYTRNFYVVLVVKIIDSPRALLPGKYFDAMCLLRLCCWALLKRYVDSFQHVTEKMPKNVLSVQTTFCSFTFIVALAGRTR